MNKKFLWLRVLLSAVLISFLFYIVDLQEMIGVFTRANYTFLLIAFLIAIADRILMAYKWNFLLRAKGINISLIRVTGTYLISTFLGLFLPATVGGDALRAYAITRKGHKGSDVISSIIVERILGFVSLFIFVLISIALSINVFGQSFFAGIWNLFWMFLLLLIISFILIAASFNPSLLKRGVLGLQKWVVKPRTRKVAQKLEELYYSYRSYQHQRSHLGIFFFLSFVENLFPLFWTYFLARAFEIEVPLLYFFILIPIVLVLVRLPISLDGIGIQEGAFVYFLVLIDVSQSEALFLSVVSHLLGILSILPGGILYALYGLNFQTTSREIQTEAFLELAVESQSSKVDVSVELKEDLPVKSIE